MHISEAYKILEIDENISDDDLKKHYKKLAKTYHPDLTKDPEKFKKINEAHQLIKDYRENKDKYNAFDNSGDFGFGSDISNFINFNEVFQRVNQHNVHLQPPAINLNLTFEQCILGCDQDITYRAYRKCEACNSSGNKVEGNGCTDCDGFGHITQRNQNMTIKTMCNKCRGQGVKRSRCNECLGNGSTLKEISGKIHIQPGIPSGSAIRLQGHGHFVSSSFMGDSHTDVIVNIIVEEKNNMKLAGQDVVSYIDLSLYEAIKGKSLEVDTVYGKKNIEVKSKSKNKEEINIEKCGVANTAGVHKVILNVNYPDNIDEFVELIK